MGYIALGVALLTMLPQGAPASRPNAPCKRELTRESKFSNNGNEIRGDFSGYKRAPIIAFEVDEFGVVQNAQVKRGSGSPFADKLALQEVRRWKYKPAPGCGVVQSEATVTVDFAAP